MLPLIRAPRIQRIDDADQTVVEADQIPLQDRSHRERRRTVCGSEDHLPLGPWGSGYCLPTSYRSDRRGARRRRLLIWSVPMVQTGVTALRVAASVPSVTRLVSPRSNRVD